MFTDFFYLLRDYKFGTSITEWMTLMEGLERGLHHSSLKGFYDLCRAILVKSEADYDKFDGLFLNYFKDVPWEGELPEELLNWLNNPEIGRDSFVEFLKKNFDEKTAEEIRRMFEERLKEQNEEHNGGSYWIGTDGYSAFGNGGHSEQGIRVGGESHYRRAFEVIGERRYRDFRTDQVLDSRQFQRAFRMLRQLSERGSAKRSEFDVDETIHDTCEQAGVLQVRYKKPRTNAIRLLMLIDSGGSMEIYSKLCATLFQSVQKANHFQDLKVFYFHNCVYKTLYKTPQMRYEDRVPTEWLLKNLGPEYRLIVVGDALMDLSELTEPLYSWQERSREPSGLDWLRRLKNHYEHAVWLNPEPAPNPAWYWGRSYGIIEKVFDMYPLSVDGLMKAMKKLMVRS